MIRMNVMYDMAICLSRMRSFFLPSIKSSSVWARFCMRPRQFLVRDVAANVVVVVVVGTVVVLAFALVRYSFGRFVWVSINDACSSSAQWLFSYLCLGWFEIYNSVTTICTQYNIEYIIFIHIHMRFGISGKLTQRKEKKIKKERRMYRYIFVFMFKYILLELKLFISHQVAVCWENISCIRSRILFMYGMRINKFGWW